MADWCVYQAIFQNLKAADDYFVFPAGEPKMGAMYADPTAYVNGLIEMFNIFNNWFHSPTDATFLVTMAVFGPGGLCDMLKQMPVSAIDPNSASIWTAWTTGTGGLPGGHTATQTSTGDGTNAATGQSAAPPGSIL
jgi:hypothetical protein